MILLQRRFRFWHLEYFFEAFSRFTLQSCAGICRINRQSRSFRWSLLLAAAAKRQIPPQGFPFQSGLKNSEIGIPQVFKIEIIRSSFELKRGHC